MPLGFERLKICELFAELLHCSNMAHLNKPLSKHHQARANYVNTIASPNAEEPEETPTDDAEPTAKEGAEDEQLYIADYMKLQFIKHRVLPTCLVSGM
jgi:serine/threonine-protein phosphatase 6 regulatory subunit 3